eukprot:TRINITY_DN13564_c1_g6_i1.p1 TRINITY_DN13564_c1_g6~~TRINITY_DN13564_c1_g6_i1.p1  ORF type:complete len:378 (-),score=133.69 TRINITY_DN13564_c1_g6_i1:193-1326(-)
MASEALSAAQARLAEAKAFCSEKTVEEAQMLHGFEAPRKPPKSKQDQRQAKANAAEALSLAKDALVSFRRAGESQTKVAALKVVIDANMIMGNNFDALMAATDEVAMIQKAGDKEAEAAVLQMLIEVHAERGDLSSAVQSAVRALDLQRELGSKSGEAQALRRLAKLKLDAGKCKEAVSLATQGVGLFQQLKDAEGEADCKRMVNRGCAESGEVERAPDREQAVKALEDLAAAVENSDAVAWRSAVEGLNKCSAFSQQDVQQIFGEALKKDRQAASAFLKEQGIRTSQSCSAELIIEEVVPKIQYMNFRLTGLCYGPRFRLLQPANKLSVQGDPDSLTAVACLKVADEAESWETDLMYQPSILDNMLQSQYPLAGMA